MRTFKAAVAWGIDQPLAIETVTCEEPVGNDVLVRMAASGLCHSDLHLLNGSIPTSFPIVLGHEGSGVVVSCGPDVTTVAPGDHVIPLFCPECRECKLCTSGKTNRCLHFDPGGRSQTQMWIGDRPLARMNGLGTFAEYCVVPEIALAKVRVDAPLDKIFYCGCGVTTGVGSVVFSARVERGASVIVFGVGGIGLNVLQGARLAGAGSIIAVDTNPDRAAIAAEFGATAFVNPHDHGGDLAAHLMELTQGGADYTFECVGNVNLMRTASEASHPNWGVVTVIGAATVGTDATLNPYTLIAGRRWQGTFFGGAKGRTDVPTIVDWYMQGKIAIDPLITHSLALEQINEGFGLMKQGQSIRTAILFPPAP